MVAMVTYPYPLSTIFCTKVITSGTCSVTLVMTSAGSTLRAAMSL